jgi:hypothetical protein
MAVELGSLKAVRHYDHSFTSAMAGLDFGNPQERSPQALAAMTLVDPQV